MPSSLTTTCTIAGGGPAGMMLGLLLARAGVDVVVLEKHADFLRDFRGDTIHPSTLEVMHELGVLEEFLKLPHQRAETLSGVIGGETIHIADFRHLPTHCGFIALMPQWDFLDFLADQGKLYPGFTLKMRAEVTELIEEGGRIAGVRATTPDGPLEIRAMLTVGADGRHSIVRAQAGLAVDDLGAPMDVLWMHLSRRPEDGENLLGRIEAGRIFVMLNRGDYWQCAFVIQKGGIGEVKQQGLPAFREAIAQLAPSLRDRLDEIRSWDDIKLLTVVVDRLRRWYRPGLLCIGDAAHAMSPIGGVGINLAIQDAVAASNILAAPLRDKSVTIDDLQAVQRRRQLPTRLTQRMQVLAQNGIIRNVLKSRGKLKAPLPLKLFNRFPVLRRIPARLIGMGVRPEHVRIPERR
ncbi:MAG: FAD-dependent oxidoreductase [Rhizobiales bacterium]|nr:FAD-dependent oxidoreductase [Hyphomicrobiales bacterium]